jgi:hypothetical protein
MKQNIESPVQGLFAVNLIPSGSALEMYKLLAGPKIIHQIMPGVPKISVNTIFQHSCRDITSHFIHCPSFPKSSFGTTLSVLTSDAGRDVYSLPPPPQRGAHPLAGFLHHVDPRLSKIPDAERRRQAIQIGDNASLLTLCCHRILYRET